MSAQEKVAIVTGGARGIGKACAMDLARAGYALVLVDLLEKELVETAALVSAEGREVLTFVADVSSHQRAGEVVAQTIGTFGRIDFLLNNAGSSAPVGILEISEDEFDRAIAINLKSCFNYIQHTAPHMLKQGGGGSIVNTSSMSSIRGAAGFAAYASSKYGVNGLTRAAAVEYAARNIRVNTVLPGVIDTPMTDAVMGEEGTKWALTRIPMRRIGSTQEMANPIVWLCSDEASYITGVVLPVDGGWEPG